jgi:hypothetical protein
MSMLIGHAKVCNSRLGPSHEVIMFLLFDNVARVISGGLAMF